MKATERNVTFRLHNSLDTGKIVTMINRDPFHMLHGITPAEFEKDLDEPGEKVRDNTFVVEFGQTAVGYLSLCFVEQQTHIDVYCYGMVDMDWRRQGIGTAIFQFIFDRLDRIAREEKKPIRFIHRALTRIAGEAELGINFGMREQHIMEILTLNNMSDLRCAALPPGFHFRTPTIEDASAWAQIYNDAFGGSKKAESIVHEFQGPGFSPNLYILCIGDNGEPIGFLASLLRGTRARIATVAVKQQWRRLGVGTALVSEIVRRLKLAGAEEVSLSVEGANDAAKALYRKFGFQSDYKRIHYAAFFKNTY